MNSLLLFIPPAICLVLVFVGLACAILATIGLRKTRAARNRHGTPTTQPPLLSEAIQRAPTSPGCWTLCFKGLLALGVGVLLVGLLGVWSTKVSIRYERRPVAEWSDGRAPELEPLIRKHCVPFIRGGKSVGMAVALVTPAHSTVMTFGHPALSAGAPTRADTLFEIGSITKTFTGLVLARQTERGKVSLNQPIRELLPPDVELPDEARGITLRQLTSHSSGFPRMPDDWSPWRSLRMVLFGSDPYAGYTTADLLADVRRVKLESKPGTKACYSNFGMTLLGYLLAANEGPGYEPLVKWQVCLPLGMNDTTITPSRGQARRVAQGYRAIVCCGPLVLALRSAPWFERNDLGGAGALRSTAVDMLKYLQANMHPEGQPIESALRESHQVLFKEDERTAFGMNWIRTRSERLAQPLIWHNGGTGGFRSFIGFTEDSRWGVLVLSNSSEDVDDLAVALLRELAKPPASKERPPNRRLSPVRAARAVDQVGAPICNRLCATGVRATKATGKG
jgi:CubicO group peptidase (beta-lactamase class C family)